MAVAMLQHHDSEEIYQKAQKILREYFAAEPDGDAVAGVPLPQAGPGGFQFAMGPGGGQYKF